MDDASPALVIKNGTDLEPDEVGQMLDALQCEFRIQTDPKTFSDKTFFLLKSGRLILAMGGLWKVEPFVLDQTAYTVHGVVEVVANVKGAGYGRRVMEAIRDYIADRKLTGFGFCMPGVQGFYRACGFRVAEGITQRFVYYKDGKAVTNRDGQVIFYLDGADRFMEHVLAGTGTVSIPTDGLW